MNAELQLQFLNESLPSSWTGILVVGHGTRKPAGQHEFLRLVEHMAALVPQVAVEGAFLELAEPAIAQGVAKLAERGCQSLVVVPVLLFYAGHARADIPEAVQASVERHGIRFLGMSSPLDTHQGVIDLSQLRFEQALRSAMLAEPNLSTDSGQGRGGGENIALAMVGRGTSDQIALGRMREFTRLRTVQAPDQFNMDWQIQWSETGFFAGGEPKLDLLLEQAAGAGLKTVIVQPHLLFEGELMEQLREQVATWQAARPEQTWRLAETLGAEKSLAEVFLMILAEQIASQFA